MIVALLVLAQVPGAGVVIEAAPSVDVALVARVRAACEEVWVTLGSAPSPAALRIPLEQAATIEAFVARTHRARFDAAAWAGRAIWVQPGRILDRLPDVDAVLRHECVHALLRAYRVPPLDPLHEEAVALVVSGQAARLPPSPTIAPDERAALSRELAQPTDRARYEAALARAVSTHGAQVRKLLREGVLLATLRSGALD